jgi:aspartyl aminopeptidase
MEDGTMAMKEFKEKVLLKSESAWSQLDKKETEAVFSFSEGYKKFLDEGKTERECARYMEREAKEKGFKSIVDVIAEGKKIQAGDKIYANNRDKSIILFVIGQEDIEKGMHIAGGHIDAPRIDLKQRPLYEESDMAWLKTHYYGGIKKYQWAASPLAIHGRIIKTDGEILDISIGEDQADPVFMITDILPHLGKDQAAKKMGEGITGEGLNILIGNMPIEDEDEKDKVKLNIMKMLNDKYGIVEADFETAEIEIVPAGKARDLGFDRSMVSGYGHDDRVCSYAGFESILEIEKPMKTAVGMFMDKEEVGSQGNTGSESLYFEHCVAELINLQSDKYSELLVRRSLANTQVLSADVGAAFDPNFASAYDPKNSAYLGKGLLIMKYTGSRGKGGSSDANAEYLSVVRSVFNDNDVVWQTGELGKVDQGGGGTIAYILANAGAEVVDCGVPVLSMHAPYEVISKVDLYMAYKGYKAFLNR